MQIYNTLTRKLEEFKSIEPGKIRFYHCGPTVYWVQHIGNLRGMTCADLIRRSLQYLGYSVKFVRNYTDVGHLTSDADEGEDKMEKGVKREGLSPEAVANKYIKIFDDDCAEINILPPDFKPRATEYIPQMLKFIQILTDKGYAYQTEKAIYYDISKFKNYNQLNHQKIDFNKQGLGKGEISDDQKKHASDFVLWFFKTGVHKNALQTWDSHWGKGFPGWHLECSAMSKELLGETIDIHMGGIEHIAVHHTNEIAQTETVTGKKFVNYWLHNEHLKIDSKKMAKSEGTGFTLAQVKEKGFDPLDLRYFFLTSHYRSQQNFTWQALSDARQARLNLITKIKELRQNEEKNNVIDQSFKNKFIQAIEADFNIPLALAITWEVLKSDLTANQKLATIFDFDRVLGLNLTEVKADVIPEEIIQLAEKRLIAKKNRDFSTADNLRKQIKEKGYFIEDRLNTYSLKKTDN